MHDPVELLARRDKWYLGCGDGIIFAPPFPLWLDAPGFWDEATFYQYPFGPLFTVTFVDADGRELPATLIERRWTPADLTARYRLGEGLEAVEVRSVQPGGVFVSEWRVQAELPQTLHALAWTAQPAEGLEQDTLACDGASLGFARTVRDRRDVPLRVRAELTALGGITSWCALLSEDTPLHPHWALAPFAEYWRQEALPSALRPWGIAPEGVVYAAVHRALPRGVSEMQVTFAVRLSAADVARDARASQRLTPRSAGALLGVATLAGVSRRRWRELFDLAPRFSCSDPYFERYYWYRWYGLWLNGIQPGMGQYAHHATCEGIGVFHQPIAFSAPCHMRELRWLSEPEYARGVWRTLFAAQREDGSIPGRVYMNHLSGTDFYHADWGPALDALDAVHPDARFAAEAYEALARYARWLLRTRDAEGSGMIDVLDQYETGQEYMTRYLAVDEQADRHGWENRLRLKGVDATVFAYGVLRALERLAGRDRPHESGEWSAAAMRVAGALRERMWDEQALLFTDVDPASGRATGVRAAVGFYPFASDLAGAEHIAALEETLLDPALFWTTYPVPSSPLADAHFSDRSEWRGKRHACPWNGRVWPMVNSHLVTALGRWATPERPRLRAAAVHLLRRFIHMMFFAGEATRPNCFEHYNPFTGRPSTFRGIDDYQHSWVADLIIQYVCGLRPDAAGLTVDPLPFGLESARLDAARIAGRRVGIAVEGASYAVTVDGETFKRPLGEPTRLDW